MNEDFEALISVPPGGVDTHETTRSRIIQDINALRGSNDFRSFTPEQQQKALTILYDNNISTYLTQMGYNKSRIQGAKQSYFNYLLGPQAPKQAEIIGTPEYEKKKNLQPYIEQTIYGGQSPEVPQERVPLPEEQPPTSGGSWTSLLSDQLLSGLKNVQPSVAQQPQAIPQTQAQEPTDEYQQYLSKFGGGAAPVGIPQTPIEQAAQPFLQEAQQEAAQSMSAVPSAPVRVATPQDISTLEKEYDINRIAKSLKDELRYVRPLQETEDYIKLSEAAKNDPKAAEQLRILENAQVPYSEDYKTFVNTRLAQIESGQIPPAEAQNILSEVANFKKREEARREAVRQQNEMLNARLGESPEIVKQYIGRPLLTAHAAAAKGIAGTAGTTIQGAGALGSLLYQTIAEPNKEGYTPADNVVYNIGKDISEAFAGAPQYQFQNPIANIAFNDLPQAAGSLIVTVAPGMIAAKGLSMAGLGGQLATKTGERSLALIAGATGGLSSAGSTYSEAIDKVNRGEINPDTGKPLTPLDAYKAMLVSMVGNTALETAGFVPVFRGMNRVVGADRVAQKVQDAWGGIAQKGYQYGKVGLAEGITEAGQNILTDMTAQQYYDFSREIDLAQAGKEGILGFILGAGLKGTMPQGNTLEEQVLIQKTNEGILDKGVQEGAITPEAADMIRQTANEQATRMDKKPPFQEATPPEPTSAENAQVQPIVTNETEIKVTPEVREVDSQPVNPNMISRLEQVTNEPTLEEVRDAGLAQPPSQVDLDKNITDLRGRLNKVYATNQKDINTGRIDASQIAESGLSKLPLVSGFTEAQRAVLKPIRKRMEDGLAKVIKKGLEYENRGIKEVNEEIASLMPSRITKAAKTIQRQAIRKAAGAARGLMGGVQRTTAQEKARMSFGGQYKNSGQKATRLAKGIRKLVLDDELALARVSATFDPEFAMLNPEGISPSYNAMTEGQREAFDIARPIVQRFNMLPVENKKLYAGAAKNRDVFESLNEEQKKEFNAVVRPYLQLSDAQVDLYDQVRSEMPTYEKLDEQEKNAHDALRTVYDYVHDANYAMGFISPETYEKYKGKYAARMYEEYELDDLLSNDQVIDAIPEEEFVQRYGVAKGDFKKMILGRDGTQMRQELASINKRAMMDPTYAMARRLQQVYENKAILDYGNKLQKEGLVSDEPKPGWVKLDSPATYPKYGPISNKYVPQWVHEDFAGFYYMNNVANMLYNAAKAYDKFGYRRFMKKYFTVFDPTTSIGNFGSNWVFALNNGINPLQFTSKLPEARNIFSHNTGEKSIVGTLMSGVDKLKKKSGPTQEQVANYEEVYDYLADAGLMNVGIMSGELAPLKAKKPSRQFVNVPGRNRAQIVEIQKSQNKLDKIREKITKADKSLVEMYQSSDDISKIAAFLSHTDNLSRIYPKKTKEQIWEMAAENVSDGFQNYTKVGKTWDAFSKTPVIGGPFIKFKGDLMRIIKNSALTTPLTSAAYLSMMAGAAKGLASLAGEDEEERAFREQRSFTKKIKLPDWAGGDISLEWNTPVGYVDVSRFLTPYYVYDKGAADDVLGTITERISPVDLHYKDGAFSVERGDPILGPIIDLLKDEDFRGKSIADPTISRFNPKGIATESERMSNRLTHALRSYVPYYQTLDDYYRMTTQGTDYFGRRFTPGQMIMKKMGLKVSPYRHDVEGFEAFQRQLKTYEYQLKDIKTRATVSENEMAKTVNKAFQDEGYSKGMKDKILLEEQEKLAKRIGELKKEYLQVSDEAVKYEMKYGHLFEKNK